MDKIVEERQKLQEHLEEQKALIRDDIQDLKQSVRPLTALKNIATDIWTDVRGNTSAAKTVKFAAKMLPAKLRGQPAVYVTLEYVLPFILKNYPHLVNNLKNYGVNLPNVKKSAVLGGAKERISRLRQKVRSAKANLEAHKANKALPYSPNTDQLYV
jgi:hypothetical protein